MRSIILFDDPTIRLQLLPFTYTRPVAGIRCGIWTIAEKWSKWLKSEISYQTESHLRHRFPLIKSEDNFYINGALCPDASLIEAIEKLSPESVLLSKENEILAVRTSSPDWTPAANSIILDKHYYEEPIILIRQVWDIFLNNGAQIKADFAKITAAKQSAKLTDPFTFCYNPENIFIEEGALIKAAILNAENGPIYIGKNASIQEGAIIQGPFAIGESSVLAQGAKIRPNTTVGPFCKVGGEVSNCVIFGYSNKGHDGYLGNSVLGEWCNLGANTNNSNLKNDHTAVKLHSYITGKPESTGLLFCGLFMGDYSKAGISTMFNTGTVVGVSVNVFGAGFQSKHIPSFSWGGNAEGFTEYRFEKAIAVAKDTVSRRGIKFDETDEKIVKQVFDQTKNQR
ncbi:putative sugar nucleotidyl transferase [Dyadobacter frigoris]|uniref:Glucose-1-phosphate thymidylyltransferase n=1 Tax=Dyadobacter frigoris TaxID=2576211 RepID=A0A4U6D0A7_9BACT|nr:putative sugar nucleotidyl transferase [Dyadobacter frigoris]TKT89537.1 glucose-1-phosphate thymidylyltransferase [Dyadobacter frigoris]GLU54254.1 glucose-1-phosphate thymidylyltransferase [Dyadobacter frigoris]